MLPIQQVRLFMDLTHRDACDDPDHLVHALSAHGIPEDDAECLIAFVPMAFARVMLAPLGVKFQGTFEIRDFDTGESARGAFENEPLHAAAVEVAREMASGDGEARQRFEEMASTSAEYNAVRQLRPEGDSFEGIVLAEALLVRVPIAHLKPVMPGRARRFWQSLFG